MEVAYQIKLELSPAADHNLALCLLLLFMQLIGYLYHNTNITSYSM